MEKVCDQLFMCVCVCARACVCMCVGRRSQTVLGGFRWPDSNGDMRIEKVTRDFPSRTIQRGRFGSYYGSITPILFGLIRLNVSQWNTAATTTTAPIHNLFLYNRHIFRRSLQVRPGPPNATIKVQKKNLCGLLVRDMAGWMLFLLPKQQCQSTEWTTETLDYLRC